MKRTASATTRKLAKVPSKSSATLASSRRPPDQTLAAGNGGQFLEDAARLISQHFPPADRGAIFQRVYRVARTRPITRGFLRTAERRERIDRWRRETLARSSKARVEVVSFEDPVANVTPPIAQTKSPADLILFPEDFMRLVIGACTPREQTLVWCLFIDDIKQVEIAKILGVTESRISQLLHEIRAKLSARIKELWPRLEEEWR